MMNKLKQLAVEEEGQGLSEYGLVVAGVVVIVVAALALLEGEINELFGGLLTNEE
ncbi:Flp family type IVb pilin [Rossellomorea aquimaris]|jgi:pilus assembly protein Flp/PilA|uniref:Flp family type IVb pilin n=1 Tax=Rossellomorea aquimaris TaxID=189382 RepID=UPI000A8951CA|nr:Flp family type IVb pilin [Rossellomorea aquimaris]